MSLDEIVTALVALLAKTPAPTPTEQVIRIVSLADAPVIGSITEAHLDRLGERLGARVTLEHVCLPPSIVLLSDLVFHDWFQPRLDPVEFVAVDRAIAKLRGASVILADDMAEMFFPPQQVYGALSHNLERDPRTDLVAVRWQRYPRNHHRLPLTLVCGADLPLDQCTPALEALSRILGVPFFRMAVVAGFAEYTEGWEYRPLHGGTDAHLAVRGVIDPDEWVDRFAAWAATQPGGLRLRPATPGPRIETSDLAHFCSHYARADAIDALIARYGSFCVVGQDASVPYVRAALARAGKPFVHARSYAPEAMAKLNGQYECLLICGPQGNFPINTPAAGIMRSDSKWVTKNIDDPATAALTFHVPRPDLPASGEDWFHRFAFDRRRSAKAYVAVRIKAVRRAREAADAERVAAAKAKQRASPAPGPGQAGLSPERLALREQRLQQLRQDRREARQRERAALRQAGSQPAKPSAP